MKIPICDDHKIVRAFKSGASGYLAKDAAFDELFIAVKKIVAGERHISISVAEKNAFSLGNYTNIPKHNLLSKRKYLTMIKLARGETLLGIGKALSISNNTLNT